MTGLLAPHIAGTAYRADVHVGSDLGHDKPFIVDKHGFRSIRAHDIAITTRCMRLC
jgi:hypothetical protein